VMRVSQRSKAMAWIMASGVGRRGLSGFGGRHPGGLKPGA
jgi:hypothetical protein